MARRAGRKWFVAIGIDRYRNWSRLGNAVSDATGARAAFEGLGFANFRDPLLDEAATGKSVHSLATDELAMLGSEDSLVVFYAGHGGVKEHWCDGEILKTGYLIPYDADRERLSTWIELESWLKAIALLPPRHILVILDACHAGIALDPGVAWRGGAAPVAAMPMRSDNLPYDALDARRSRQVITSALDTEVALDGGPILGHSLFTGYLIKALTEELGANGGAMTTTHVAVWVQGRVRRYPNARQTPVLGTFGTDAHGELVLISLGAALPAELPPALSPAQPLPQPIAMSRLHFAIRSAWRDREWFAIILPLVLIAAWATWGQSCAG